MSCSEYIRSLYLQRSETILKVAIQNGIEDYEGL